MSGWWVSFIVLAQDPKSSQASTKISANTVQKPAAYRPPQAKSAAAVQAEVHIQSYHILFFKFTWSCDSFKVSKKRENSFI